MFAREMPPHSGTMDWDISICAEKNVIRIFRTKFRYFQEENKPTQLIHTRDLCIRKWATLWHRVTWTLHEHKSQWNRYEAQADFTVSNNIFVILFPFC